jgi:uncharacterized protein HemX
MHVRSRKRRAAHRNRKKLRELWRGPSVMQRSTHVVLLSTCLAAMLATASACAGEGGVLRLQQQRAQQQMELQLRMQQQQEQATRAAPDATTDPQRRQFEIEQQQRLQQFNDTQSRGAVMERPRSQGSEQAPNEQMRRFDAAPRLNTDRSIAGVR